MANFHFSQDKITLSPKTKSEFLLNNSFKTLDIRWWRTMIPERWETRWQEVTPAHCLESFRLQHREGARLSPADSKWPWGPGRTWQQLSAGQSTEEESAAQKDNLGSLQTVGSDQHTHETTWGLGQRHLNGLEAAVLGAHTGLRSTPPPARLENPTHGSSERAHRGPDSTVRNNQEGGEKHACYGVVLPLNMKWYTISWGGTIMK